MDEKIFYDKAHWKAFTECLFYAVDEIFCSVYAEKT